MVIYKIKNKINGKIYIGQTVQDLNKRVESHLKESRSNKTDRPFLNAIKKYGIENFEWETIDEAKTLDELDEKEIYWIDNYNSLVPDGYNVLGGGQKRMIVSEEFCKRISDGLKNSEKWQKTLNSIEYQEKIKTKFIGYNKGKKFTEEHKDKIRQKNAARLIEQNLNKSKSWVLVDEKNNIIRIKNLENFCQENNLDKNVFVYTLRKNNNIIKRHKGYYCFLDTKQTDSEILEKCQEYDSLNFEIILYDKRNNMMLKTSKNNLPKFCKENNLDRSNIDKVIKGKLKSYRGIVLDHQARQLQ